MTTERSSAQAYPLSWPLGWPRTEPRRRKRAAFGGRDGTNTYKATQELLAELARLGAREVLVSSNLKLRGDGIPYAKQRALDEDPGVSVWLRLRVPGPDAGASIRDGWRDQVLACDRWQRPEHNLRALVLHVAAIRGMERWGVGAIAQAFAGYQALPAKAGARAWWAVLGVERATTADAIGQAFRERARTAHPDAGGTPEAWHELEQPEELLENVGVQVTELQ